MNDIGTTSIYQRLTALGIELPDLPSPVGHFLHSAGHGDLLFFSGQGPLLGDGNLARGRVGDNVTVDEARRHARHVGLVLVSAMRDKVGSLDRIERVVRLFGMVNATADFKRHHQVMDGCSDLMHEIFGGRGAHARSVVGVASLPGGISVEIEAVVAVRPD